MALKGFPDSLPQNPNPLSMNHPDTGQSIHEGAIQKLVQLKKSFINRQSTQVYFAR